jgi:predicted aspartyl protease
MKAKRIITFLLAISILQSCVIRSLLVVSSADLNDYKSKEIAIPFEEVYGLMVVPIVIEGKTYRFIFDTGAGSTVISSELAELVSFKEKGAIKVNDAQHVSNKLPIGYLKGISLGELNYSKVGVIVNDFSKNAQFKCFGIDGILGMNVIQLNNWKIDYGTKTLLSCDLNFKPTFTESTQEFSFVSKTGIPFINLYVNGTQDKFMIDTGKNSEIISISSTVKISEKSNQSIGYASFGMFGETPMDTTNYYQVNFSDSLGFNLTDISVSQDKESRGNMGNGFFKRNYASVFFDFKNRKMYCTKPTHRATIYTSFGVSVMLSADGLVVGSKDLGFSEDVDGIAVNDQILEINGTAVTGDNVCEMTRIMGASKLENKPVTLLILQNGEKKKVVLKAKEVTVN